MVGGDETSVAARFGLRWCPAPMIRQNFTTAEDGTGEAGWCLLIGVPLMRLQSLGGHPASVFCDAKYSRRKPLIK
jgi:hypothetical protein